MFNFKYHYCKSQMVAFLNGELSQQAKQRIVRYIDDCPDCYAEYIRQRDIQRDLKAELPVFGNPQGTQLDQIWTVIQHNMQLERPVKPVRLRYSMVTLTIMFIILLPFFLDNNTVVSQIRVTQPTPAEIRTTVTAGVPLNATPVAVATLPQKITDDQIIITPEAAPQRTPNG